MSHTHGAFPVRRASRGNMTSAPARRTTRPLSSLSAALKWARGSLNAADIALEYSFPQLLSFILSFFVLLYLLSI